MENVNKAKKRAKRVDPLLRAIKAIKRVESPYSQAKLWLELAEFYYPKVKDGAKSALTEITSKSHADKAFKLLKQLESRHKQDKNFNAQEERAEKPGNDAPGTGSSCAPSLGAGEPEV